MVRVTGVFIMPGVFCMFGLDLAGCCLGRIIHVHVVHGMSARVMPGMFVMHLVMHAVRLRITVGPVGLVLHVVVFRIGHVKILSLFIQ
jgi:hypothetical protein